VTFRHNKRVSAQQRVSNSGENKEFSLLSFSVNERIGKKHSRSRKVDRLGGVIDRLLVAVTRSGIDARLRELSGLEELYAVYGLKKKGLSWVCCDKFANQKKQAEQEYQNWEK